MHTDDTDKTMKLIHENLTYKINGLCFKVHREMGRFRSERQYCDKLEILFKEEKINFKREYELVKLSDVNSLGNRVDFLIDNLIILDVKAKKFITKDDYFQMLRYLETADLQLGIIINFRNTYLKPKRIINSKFKSVSSG